MILEKRGVYMKEKRGRSSTPKGKGKHGRGRPTLRNLHIPTPTRTRRVDEEKPHLPEEKAHLAKFITIVGRVVKARGNQTVPYTSTTTRASVGTAANVPLCTGINLHRRLRQKTRKRKIFLLLALLLDFR